MSKIKGMQPANYKIVNVKFKFLILILALLPICTVNAQKKPVILSGVYLTANDYIGNKLSYSNPCGKEHKIKLNDFWGKKHITIYHNDTMVKLNKDSVFAYVDCSGKAFRFFKDYSDEYEILERKVLTIYSRNINITQPGVKGIEIVTRYYFSVNPGDSIYVLTLENVKNAFPQDHKLHDKLDEFFSDNDINAFDARHGMFRINHILQSTINGK